MNKPSVHTAVGAKGKNTENTAIVRLRGNTAHASDWEKAPCQSGYPHLPVLYFHRAKLYIIVHLTVASDVYHAATL